VGGGGEERVEAGEEFLRRGDADVVLGEVDAGFEQGDQFEQLLLDGREQAG
jgi:hypothetical protein